VDVAAGRELAGVEVGVGVEPEHAQFLAGLAAVACHRADRAQAEAVVAAQQNRQAAQAQLGVHGVVNGLVPGNDFVEVAVALDGGLPRIGRARSGCRGR